MRRRPFSPLFLLADFGGGHGQWEGVTRPAAEQEPQEGGSVDKWLSEPEQIQGNTLGQFSTGYKGADIYSSE